MIARDAARQAAEETYSQAAAALEEKIDSLIRCNTDGAVYVDIRGVPAPAVAVVVRKFRDGGWTVTVASDQRDGPSMTLW